MSLSDCPKCWETPCVCGYKYKDWNIERVTELRDVLNEVLKNKEWEEKKKISNFKNIKEIKSNYNNLTQLLPLFVFANVASTQDDDAKNIYDIIDLKDEKNIFLNLAKELENENSRISPSAKYYLVEQIASRDWEY